LPQSEAMTIRKPASATARTRKPAVPALDGQTYRDAMARVASAVHIISTDGAAGLAGLTMTAIASISDKPPSLLICVNRTLHSGARLIENGVFCVNTLAAEDQPLADVFAGRTGLHLDERFRDGDWTTLVTGAPVLTSALAVFDCRVVEVRDIATHHVIVGEVAAARSRPMGGSLTYLDREYRRV
jgi:flavin reductase